VRVILLRFAGRNVNAIQVVSLMICLVIKWGMLPDVGHVIVVKGRCRFRSMPNHQPGQISNHP
jgi:hypothetical protein